jgi:hypothetical protein
MIRLILFLFKPLFFLLSKFSIIKKVAVIFTARSLLTVLSLLFAKFGNKLLVASILLKNLLKQNVTFNMLLIDFIKNMSDKFGIKIPR